MGRALFASEMRGRTSVLGEIVRHRQGRVERSVTSAAAPDRTNPLQRGVAVLAMVSVRGMSTIMENEKMKEPTTVTLDVREIPPDEQHPVIIGRLNALEDLTPLYEHFLTEHSDLFSCEQEQQGPEEWALRIQKKVRSAVAPSGKHDDEGHVHETSHVIQCMQCGLQFQADTIAVSHGGVEEEQLVRLRLPEDISPMQRAMAEQMYERIEGGGQMRPLTQPLREEHRELLPHVERLHTLADAIGTASIETIRQGVEEASTFLTHQLLPHAQAEERVLYPTIGKLMGAPEATATMSRDHQEIGRLIQELETLRSQLGGADVGEAQALRRILYGLYAVVALHFAKEEEIYLPLLDTRLTPQEARQMFQEMEEAAQEAKRNTAS